MHIYYHIHTLHNSNTFDKKKMKLNIIASYQVTVPLLARINSTLNFFYC